MHRVEQGLDLSSFVGLAVTQICLSRFQIQLGLDPQGHIAVEDALELVALDGTVLGAGEPLSLHASIPLGRLVGDSISGAQAEPPQSVLFTFRSGYRLRLFTTIGRTSRFSLTRMPISSQSLLS